MKNKSSNSTVTHCGNLKCRTTQTPLWRKGWKKEGAEALSGGKPYVMLCNSCGLHYKKGHFCCYCNQIYKEKDADDGQTPWLACERCYRWTHIHCETKHNPNFEQEKEVNGGKFFCRDCKALRGSLNNDDGLFLQTFPDVKKRRRKPSPGSPERTRSKTSRPKSRFPKSRDDWDDQEDEEEITDSRTLSNEMDEEAEDADEEVSSSQEATAANSSEDEEYNPTHTVSNNRRPSPRKPSTRTNGLRKHESKMVRSNSRIEIDGSTVSISIDISSVKSVLETLNITQNKFGLLCAVCEYELQKLVVPSM